MCDVNEKCQKLVVGTCCFSSIRKGVLCCNKILSIPLQCNAVKSIPNKIFQINCNVIY